MKIKFIEQWMFKLSGRSMPCVKIDDIDETGLVGAVHFVGNLKLRANSLQNTWETKAYEVKQESRKITIIDSRGLTTTGYAISPAGETVNLYTTPRDLPDAEDVLGAASMMDDIGESMNLNKSMRNLAIGIVIGTLLGWMIVAPMMGQILK